MVMVYVIHGESENSTGQLFPYECHATTNVLEMMRDMVEIANLQSKLQRIVHALERLVDPLGRMDNGNGFVGVLRDAREYVPEGLARYIDGGMKIDMLKGQIQAIQKELNKDPLLFGFFGQKQIQDFIDADGDQLKVEDVFLWWAGVELKRDKQLRSYVGEIEKNKVLMRLLKCGASINKVLCMQNRRNPAWQLKLQRKRDPMRFKKVSERYWKLFERRNKIKRLAAQIRNKENQQAAETAASERS